MKESSFGVLFGHWIKAYADKLDLQSCTFELKQTSTDSLPFSAVEQGQADHALAVRWASHGALIRVASGTAGAPDYVFYRYAPAFIAIKYPSGFVLIDIDTFLLEKERSKRRSLTWTRACEIAWKVVQLKKK